MFWLPLCLGQLDNKIDQKTIMKYYFIQTADMTIWNAYCKPNMKQSTK